MIYGSALHGWMVRDLETHKPEGLDALLQMIVDEVPAPPVDREAPFRMQVSTLAWNDHIGRIGCGRVLEGSHRKGDPLVRTATQWRNYERLEGEWDVVAQNTSRSTHLWVMRGLERLEVDEVAAGDIVWLSGPEEITIGDTFSAPEVEKPALPPLEIEEPTVSMFFLVNTSPLAGQDGRVLTLRQIKERLDREFRVNVALRVEDLGRADGVKVSGRGELHLGILIEEMRREGIEMCVSRPEVITKRDDAGRLLEPIEQLLINLPEEYQGVVIEKLAKRKGEIIGHDAHRYGRHHPRIRDPHPRPHRLPRRLPHRHPRPGHHVVPLHRLRRVARRSRASHAGALWWRRIPATRPPGNWKTCRPAASSSSPPWTASTKA